MILFPELEKRYTREVYSTREAQRQAEFIAFGPIVFEASRLMVKHGILDMLRDNAEGLTMEEITDRCSLTPYAVKCLMEAALTIGTVLVDPATDRFTLSKVGWFLLTDNAARVNLDFNHDVNYKGFFHLDESFQEGKPVGLKLFGDWATIYEGLSQLPPAAQKSWFGFDHFYSDHSFDDALKLVFSRKIRNLLDVGGNTGRWATQCVRYDPQVHVTILDLPAQIALMRRATADVPGSDRIEGIGMDMLDPQAQFPTDKPYDAIWMSQFLDCFSEKEIVSILSRAAAIMQPDTRLYIMELLWNRQKYEPAAFCITMTSLYFAAMANGNSKMYYSEDLERLIDQAGLQVDRIVDGIGQGHNILICSKK